MSQGLRYDSACTYFIIKFLNAGHKNGLNLTDKSCFLSVLFIVQCKRVY